MSKSNGEFVTFIYNQTVLLSFKSYYFMKLSDTQNLVFSTMGHVKVDGDYSDIEPIKDISLALKHPHHAPKW